jgi:aliphatic nitrilase
MGNEEGILYADLDLELCAKHKLEHHFSGHYNRPDMFQLSINRQTPMLYSEAKEQSGTAEAVDDSEAGEQKGANLKI